MNDTEIVNVYHAAAKWSTTISTCAGIARIRERRISHLLK
jgi:hypothetical protein